VLVNCHAHYVVNNELICSTLCTLCTMFLCFCVLFFACVFLFCFSIIATSFLVNKGEYIVLSPAFVYVHHNCRFVTIFTRADGRRGGRVFPRRVCLSVCFPHDISKAVHLGSPNVTQKCSGFHHESSKLIYFVVKRATVTVKVTRPKKTVPAWRVLLLL